MRSPLANGLLFFCLDWGVTKRRPYLDSVCTLFRPCLYPVRSERMGECRSYGACKKRWRVTHRLRKTESRASRRRMGCRRFKQLPIYKDFYAIFGELACFKGVGWGRRNKLRVRSFLFLFWGVWSWGSVWRLRSRTLLEFKMRIYFGGIHSFIEFFPCISSGWCSRQTCKYI